MNTKRKVESDGFIFKIVEGAIYVFFVVFGFYLTFLLRYNFKPQLYNLQPYYDSIPYIIIASIIVFYIYNIVTTLKKSLFENALIIFISLVLIDIITVAIAFFNRGFSFPRGVFLLGFIVQFILIFLTKLLILKVLKLKSKTDSILIIASKEESDNLARKLLLDKYNHSNIKYICESVDENTKSLIDEVDKVYIGSTIESKIKLDIIKYCTERSKAAYIIPSYYEITLSGFKTHQVLDMLIFKLEKLGLTYEQRVMKRFIDIIISLIVLLITSPILLITAISIKLHDRGPVFYKQERITEDNKIFDLYKFRTMIVDAEEHTGPTLAIDDDPRITSVGKTIRGFRIDELPQLINVLKGEMSIVGPRPERPYFADMYNNDIEGYKYRVYVKAGITGFAQIFCNYSTDAITKAKYDLLYIKNYSLLLDMKIIFNTIKIIFIRDKAKGVERERQLEEIFNELGLSTIEELGITKIE